MPPLTLWLSHFALCPALADVLETDQSELTQITPGAHLYTPVPYEWANSDTVLCNYQPGIGSKI
jgi:hypothetical protein